MNEALELCVPLWEVISFFEIKYRKDSNPGAVYHRDETHPCVDSNGWHRALGCPGLVSRSKAWIKVERKA